jgi:hypothetical protein
VVGFYCFVGEEIVELEGFAGRVRILEGLEVGCFLALG